METASCEPECITRAINVSFCVGGIHISGWKFEIQKCSFESLDAAGGEQGPHLGDGDVVEGDWVKAEILKS